MGLKERRGGTNRGDVRSFQRVRKFLNGLGGRRPERGELEAITPDLRALYEKVCKLQRISPSYRSVDLSADVWTLLDIAGVAPRQLRSLRDAAAS
ncbi:MAG TPA: hypothetical protein VI643_03400 [Planctomycetota bacterium]|nr:hypothetical protein [Planctomycetota bacterium]